MPSSDPGTYTLQRRTRVPLDLEATFAFFAEPGNLARITPPWLGFRMVEPADPVMGQGLELEYRVRPLGFSQRWVSRISVWEPPHRFVDEQLAGPYASWHHEHTFRAADGGTDVLDTVTYALPFGHLGRLAHTLLVRRQLRSIFDYRETALRRILVENRAA